MAKHIVHITFVSRLKLSSGKASYPNTCEQLLCDYCQHIIVFLFILVTFYLF